MSHFSVLVIGDNVEEQLQPYHEFECTGEDDQYVQDIDVTEEEIEDFDPEDAGGQTCNYCLKYVYSEDDIDLEDEHKYGYALVKDGKLIKAINRTNPNKEWDWYQLGGRWSGFLKPKSDAKNSEIMVKGRPGLMGAQFDERGVDQALKCQIDFQGMRNDAFEKAKFDWTKTEVILQTNNLSRDWLSWVHVREVKHAGDIEAAREFYNNQPQVKLLNKDLGPFSNPDKYLISLTEYCDKAVDQAIAPYAMVMDGKWYAKGKMGWFGMSSDEVEQGDWNKKVNELIDSLPPETLITIVDCHI